jgi:hypothetical protein
MQSTQEELLRDIIRKAWIIWTAMFGSLAVAVIICYACADALKFFIIQNFSYSLTRNILLVMSAVLFVMIGNIRRFQLHGKSIAQRVAKTERFGKDSTPILLKYMSVVVISLMLSEIIGVFGVILFLLSGDFPSLLIFIAFSAVTMLMNCPKSKEVQNISDKMNK